MFIRRHSCAIMLGKPCRTWRGFHGRPALFEVKPSTVRAYHDQAVDIDALEIAIGKALGARLSNSRYETPASGRELRNMCPHQHVNPPMIVNIPSLPCPCNCQAVTDVDDATVEGYRVLSD